MSCPGAEIFRANRAEIINSVFVGFLWITTEALPNYGGAEVYSGRISERRRRADAMAYPGDFVVANRAARTEAQHATINLFVRKKRRRDLDQPRFRFWQWLAARMASTGKR